jgi:hypothetical protein
VIPVRPTDYFFLMVKEKQALLVLIDECIEKIEEYFLAFKLK